MKEKSTVAAGSEIAAAPAVPVPAGAVNAQPITLQEWAVQTSKADRRVELLNAFITEERTLRHFRDTPSAYQDRYEQFAKRPSK